MEFNPTIPQDQFIFSKDKYPAFVAGLGAGKTEGLIIRRILAALKYPKNDFAFYEPTYDLIRMIAWPRFEEILSALTVPYQLLKHPLNELKIQGAGKIIFRSMDAPGRIVGYQVADSDLDELDTLKRDDAAYVWRQALARNRQKKADNSPNTMAVATTPEGFKYVYEAWELSPKPGYKIYRAPTSSNPHLPEDYIESLRDIYPAHLLDAYLEGKFVNLTSGQVYLQFTRENNGTHETQNKGEPLFVGMDFNVGNMAAVVHVKRDGYPVAVGEIDKAYDTPDICRIIKDRYDGHSIHVYPDASGKSRKSNDASTSDLKILRDAGFSVHARPKNPRVRDRINSMNAAFQRNYKVNIDKCPNYVRCIEQQAYNNNGEPDKSQGLDHHPDSAGYFIDYEYGINKPVVKQSSITGLF